MLVLTRRNHSYYEWTVQYMYIIINLIKRNIPLAFLNFNQCSADNKTCMKHEADTCCMVKVDKRVEQ